MKYLSVVLLLTLIACTQPWSSPSTVAPFVPTPSVLGGKLGDVVTVIDKYSAYNWVKKEELAAEVCKTADENSQREKLVAELFLQAGATASEIKTQPFSPKLDKAASSNSVVAKWNNIMVVKPGRTAKTIVIGAHLDHVNAGQGAIDDWSGVCAMTNIYQAIKSVPLEHTVVFIAFAGEENGLQGSRYYVESLTEAQRQQHVAMLNLECLGVGEPHVWINGSDELMTKMLHEVATREQLPLHGHILNGVGADSNSFRAAKIPALTIDGLPADKFEFIHSAKDKCENIDKQHYYQAYVLATVYLVELDRQAASKLVNPASGENSDELESE
jgi:putative aminopeptidase FrvX